MEMEYGKAFTYPQQDADWLKKWGILGAVGLIPVLGAILTLGYGIEITRRVINNEGTLLPEWSDFGGFLRKGFNALVISLVYLLPIILLNICINVPLAILPSLVQDSDMAVTLLSVSSFVGFCLACVAILYVLIAGPMLIGALGRYAVTDQLGAALRVGEVLAFVRPKLGVFLIVMIVAGLVGSILASLGAIACGIGALWGVAYGSLVSAHLHGQAYKHATVAPAA